MNKFVKSLLVLGGTALAAHFGMKTYKKINGTIRLSKSLPEFLNNVYGEMPKVDITRGLSLMSVKVLFSQELLDKHNDIETTVREYIDDFYPDLGKSSVQITIAAQGSEADTDTCCEGEEEQEEA